MSRSIHIVDMVYFWAKAEPNRLATIQPEMVTSFQALADAIDSIAERVDRISLDKGEPVAVSISNPALHYATVFALLRCGYSVALANRPLYFHLRSAGVRNLIYDTEGQVLSGGRNIRFDMSWLPPPSASRKPYRDRPAGDGNMTFFTSGTTGRPKAFVQTMSGLTQRYSSPLNCANGDHRSALIVPGLASAFGFNRACEVLYAGKTACFAPLGEAALALINNFRVEAIVASTQQLLSLADLARGARYDLSSLKTVRIGGALLNQEAAGRIKRHLCRNIVMSYASTEAGIAAIAPYDAIADVPGAVGLLSPDAEVEIVDDRGDLLPIGAQGAIRVRTPQFLSNFAAAEAAQSTREQRQWFYPGDVGFVTDQGMLCLAGRNTDVINRGGVKISATRIEEILEACQEVKEAAACGITGASGLEEIWIAIVPQASIETAEIVRRLKEHDDVGLVVDQVFTLQNLPRNALGKIQKHILKEQLLALKGEA